MSEAILEASGLPLQLGFALRQAHVAVWADLVRTLEPFGLKPQTYATLLLVDAAPGCKQQDIADALGIQRPNIVAMIDRMVEAGWIDRQTNATDRRSYALTLAPAGRTLLDTSRVAHGAHEARTRTMLGDDGCKALVRSCRKLARLGEPSAG
jgi:DNA-binding MarR family transcriptional regulator